MKSNLCRVALAMLWAGGLLANGQAALKSAKVTDYKGEVTLSKGGATAQQVQIDATVTPSDVVRTGAKSLAELQFNDNTLTRLGANTIFSYSPKNREFEVQSGTALLQVPPGLGGAKIQTAAVTAAITGTTVMVQRLPSGVVKMMVLEGTMNVTLKGSNQLRSLKAGQMLIIPPNVNNLPQPIVVNVATVVGTSKLIKGFKTELTSEDKIEETVDKQKELTGDGGLKSGGVVITTAEDLMSLVGNQTLTSATFDALTQNTVFQGEQGSPSTSNLTVNTGAVITPTANGVLGKLTLSTGQVIPASSYFSYYEGDYYDSYYDNATIFNLAGPVTFTGQLPAASTSSDGELFINVLGVGLQPGTPAISFINSTEAQGGDFLYTYVEAQSGDIFFSNAKFGVDETSFYAFHGNINITNGSNLNSGDGYANFYTPNNITVNGSTLGSQQGGLYLSAGIDLNVSNSNATAGPGGLYLYAGNNLNIGNGSQLNALGNGFADFSAGQNVVVNGSSLTVGSGGGYLTAGNILDFQNNSQLTVDNGGYFHFTAENDLNVTGSSDIVVKKGSVSVHATDVLSIDNSTIDIIDLNGSSAASLDSTNMINISNSTIGGNSGSGNSVGISAYGNIGITNSLIGGSGIAGVSIYAHNNANLTIMNSTITGNTITLGGNVVTIQNSVITGNSITIYANTLNYPGTTFSTTPNVQPYVP